jgi:hypothetical protein
MKKMTEDIVNEICKVCIEALDNADMFVVVAGSVRKINDEESGFYPYGEELSVNSLELSIDSKRFLSDVRWLSNSFKKNVDDDDEYIGLVFSVEDDIIKMYLCSDTWDGFHPVVTFTFKKTFDDDLFD